MSNDFKHIDDLFREKLKNFAPATGKSKLWYLLSIKLLLLNLTATAWIGISVALIGVGGVSGWLIVNSVNPVKVESGMDRVTVSKNSVTIEPFQSLEISDNNLQDHKIDLRNEFSKANVIAYNPIDAAAGGTFPEQAKSSLIKNSSLAPKDHFSTRTNSFTGISSMHFVMGNLLNRDDPKPASRLEALLIADSLLKKLYPPRKLSLEAFINPSIMIGQTQTYHKIMNDRELMFSRNHPVFSPALGLELKYQTGHWYLASGFTYQTMEEKGSYQLSRERLDPNYLVQSIDTVIRWIFDPPNIGEPIILRIDTSFVPGYVTDHFNGTWKLTNHLVEIPLRVGYTFQLNAFDFDLSAAIAMDFNIKQTGGIPVVLEKPGFRSTGFPTSDVIFSYQFQAGLSYRANERISILLKPNIRHNFTSFYKDDQYPFSQHYTWLGIKAGIIYDL